MSWYKLAQEQKPRNLIQQGLGTQANPAGILVSYQDYQNLKRFGPGSGPVRVFDKDTNSEVAVVHGGIDPNGKFAFSTGTGEFVYPSEDDNWAEKLNVNQSNFIVSCHQGQDPTASVRGVKYQGKLELSMPVTVDDPSQDVRIFISGK